MVARSRIIIEYKDKDFLNQLSSYKDINIYYGNKEKYALVYCNSDDADKIIYVLNKTENKAYLSNEYVTAHNF